MTATARRYRAVIRLVLNVALPIILAPGVDLTPIAANPMGLAALTFRYAPPVMKTKACVNQTVLLNVLSKSRLQVRLAQHCILNRATHRRQRMPVTPPNNLAVPCSHNQ